MSAETIDAVDIIFRLPGEPLRCALIACEDGRGRDEHARNLAFDRKLKVYLAFVRTGQLARNHPEFSGAEIVIRVICTTAPTPHMTEIEGVYDRAKGDFVPVAVMTEAEFMSEMKAR